MARSKKAPKVVNAKFYCVVVRECTEMTYRVQALDKDQAAEIGKAKYDAGDTPYQIGDGAGEVYEVYEADTEPEKEI